MRERSFLRVVPDDGKFHQSPVRVRVREQEESAWHPLEVLGRFELLTASTESARLSFSFQCPIAYKEILLLQLGTWRRRVRLRMSRDRDKQHKEATPR